MTASRATHAPRAVIGVPSYNGEEEIEAALRSLLEQTCDQTTVIVVDDASSDGTASVVEHLARSVPRLHLSVNSRRLGMIANWNHVLRLSRQLAPDAEFFAWGSDHDLWSPRWLETMISELDNRPAAVLAYPLSERIYEHETIRAGWRFDTVGVSSPQERLAQTVRHGVAGDMIYGLFRADLVAALGGYSRVVYPDRLLLGRLAVLGEFVQTDEVLWHRRMGLLSDVRRQRATLFGGRAPVHSYLPWWLEHPLALSHRDGLRTRWTYLRAGTAVARRRPRANVGRLMRAIGLRGQREVKQ